MFWNQNRNRSLGERDVERHVRENLLRMLKRRGAVSDQCRGGSIAGFVSVEHTHAGNR